MNRLVRRVLAFLSPFLLLMAGFSFLYYRADPFRDFGPYRNYSWKYNFQILGDLSTKKFLHSDRKYNSFIFGSSRSISAYACYMNSRIPESRFFHYATWNETIGGMEKRLLLLDSLGTDLRHVLIFLDTDYSFAEKGQINSLDHWLLTGNSQLSYYFEQHLKGFADNLNDDKRALLFGGKASGSTFMNWESDTITNDANHICSQDLLLHYGDYQQNRLKEVMKLRKSGFLYKRPNTLRYAENQISEAEEKSLQVIAGILKKHQTKAWFIISPLYDQLKFSKTDSLILQKILGERIYDYSGVNRFTLDDRNYPDRKHFLPHIAKQMLDEILIKEEGLSYLEK